MSIGNSDAKIYVLLSHEHVKILEPGCLVPHCAGKEQQSVVLSIPLSYRQSLIKDANEYLSYTNL